MKRLLYLLVVLCGCEVQSASPPKVTPPEPNPIILVETTEPDQPQGNPQLTAENFAAIQVGDQLADVEQMLGSEYRVEYERQCRDSSTHILLWKSGRKTIRIMFVGYKVHQKSSMNL